VCSTNGYATLPPGAPHNLIHDDDSSAEPGARSLLDPVKAYLRQIGSVPLLTREREVEIAKRTESGQHQVLSALVSSPMACEELLRVSQELDRHQLRPCDAVCGLDEDDPDFDEA